MVHFPWLRSSDGVFLLHLKPSETSWSFDLSHVWHLSQMFWACICFHPFGMVFAGDIHDFLAINPNQCLIIKSQFPKSKHTFSSFNHHSSRFEVPPPFLFMLDFHTYIYICSYIIMVKSYLFPSQHPQNAVYSYLLFFDFINLLYIRDMTRMVLARPQETWQMAAKTVKTGGFPGLLWDRWT